MSLTKMNKEQKKAGAPSVGTLAVARPSLAGEIAIITGASSGIGEATAWELARRGAHVVLAARRVNELEANAKAITEAGHSALALPTDITDVEQVTRLVERTLEMFGRVDILVNDAGMAWKESFFENSMEQITHIVNVNLLGAIRLSHAVLPGMLERHHGAIISVASVAADIPVDPLYSATKYGVRGFSLSLYRDLIGSGVSASLVSPGFIRTPMNRHMRLHMPGPEIVARAIADLAVHPRREVIVPGYYRLLVLAEHLLPRLADYFVNRGRSRIEPGR